MLCSVKWVCDWLGGMRLPTPGCFYSLRAQGVTHVVKLAEDYEVSWEWPSIDDYRREAEDAGLTILDYPIRDYHAPSSEDSVCRLARLVLGLASRGSKIVFHCYGGTGRTPMMITAVLIACGYSLDRALSIVRERMRVVDLTDIQEMFLRSFEMGYRGCASTVSSELCAKCGRAQA